MAYEAPSTLWWQEQGEARAKNVIATVDSYSSEQDQRRNRALKNLRLYEGRPLAELNPRSYYDAGAYVTEEGSTYRCNLARALVSTAVAKIAGKQRPKAAFCATEADWSVKRKAKKKERFVEAAMLARQGNYHDAYSVGLMAFRDACVADVGVIKFWADKQGRRVAIDRVLPWELIVDPNESRAGAPLNYFHDYGYDRFKLLEQFQKVKGAEEAIMTAPAVSDNYVGGYGRGGVRDKARLVRVCEAWRMALSDKRPGAHALIVGNFDLAQGEEWTRAFPPFEFITWEPWFMGAFGTSLLDIAAPLVCEYNEAFQRWADAEKLGSNQRTYYRKNSCDKAALESNEACIAIEVAEGAEFPQDSTPQTMGQASIEWQTIVKQLIYEVPGVSQMDATARKEPGITADVAIRTMQNIGAERFAVQWQQYERVMAIGATRQILACVKELEEDGEGVVMRFPSGKVLEELKSSDFADYDVPDEAIQVQVVSGLVNTAADRLDLGEKLFGMGVISEESFKRIIQYKDLEGELASGNKQGELLDKYIEQWLDAEQVVKGKKGQVKKPLTVPVSLKWMSLEPAIVQVGQAAMQAELDDAPDYNIKFFIDFLKIADKELQKRAAAQAAMAPQVPPGQVGQPATGPVGVPMGAAA